MKRVVETIVSEVRHDRKVERRSNLPAVRIEVPGKCNADRRRKDVHLVVFSLERARVAVNILTRPADAHVRNDVDRSDVEEVFGTDPDRPSICRHFVSHLHAKGARRKVELEVVRAFFKRRTNARPPTPSTRAAQATSQPTGATPHLLRSCLVGKRNTALIRCAATAGTSKAVIRRKPKSKQKSSQIDSAVLPKSKGRFSNRTSPLDYRKSAFFYWSYLLDQGFTKIICLPRITPP